jgi:hypothetical protein
MFNSENGPGQIFSRLRTRVGVTYDQYSNPVGSNWIAEGILCFFCLSVWIAFGVGALVVIGLLAGRVEIALGILFPFALSGGSVYLKKAVG